MFKVMSLLLALAQAADPHVVDSWQVESTAPLSGTDFSLIEQAYKHPQMRGRNLSCYHILVVRKKGVATVAFVGDRPSETVSHQGETTVITMPGPNSRCPSRSFEMDENGKVARAIYERH